MGVWLSFTGFIFALIILPVLYYTVCSAILKVGVIMVKISKFFKKASVSVCMGGAIILMQGCQKAPAEPQLSEHEIKIRANHAYWDQVASITNVCAASSTTYTEMSDKLKAIPTDDVDPDAVKVVQKYVAPGLARFANFDQMGTELPWKIGITVVATLATLGGSEAADGADAVDGVDAVDGLDAVDSLDTADVMDDAAEAADATDAASDAVDLAQLSDVADGTQLADIADKIDVAGGLEAVMGQVPSRGWLGIGATIRYYHEKPIIPKIKHIVSYRIGRERRVLQASYGGTFQPIHLNTPAPCG